MEKLLEYDDITLIPREVNEGWGSKKVNYFVQNPGEYTGIRESLPIFTSPMEAVVGVDNWKVYQEKGILPILPRTVDLISRLEACGSLFSAFSIQEVEENFLRRDLRGTRMQYHICIDSGNGHDLGMINLGGRIKKLYGDQVILMGGNIGNCKTYEGYSRNGFDYVRVGISSGSIVDKKKFGFHYPMVSLLDNISRFKKSNKNQLPKDVKVIADGGITCHSDILKAIALGADYVMIGREFSKLIEASGTIYKRTTRPNPEDDILEEVKNPEKLLNLTLPELTELDLARQYFGNTTPEMQALRDGYHDIDEWRKEKPKIKVTDSEWQWVKISGSLEDWVRDLKECINYGFMMSGSSGWSEFKEKSMYGRIK